MFQQFFLSIEVLTKNFSFATYAMQRHIFVSDQVIPTRSTMLKDS